MSRPPGVLDLQFLSTCQTKNHKFFAVRLAANRHGRQGLTGPVPVARFGEKVRCGLGNARASWTGFSSRGSISEMNKQDARQDCMNAVTSISRLTFPAFFVLCARYFTWCFAWRQDPISWCHATDDGFRGNLSCDRTEGSRDDIVETSPTSF